MSATCRADNLQCRPDMSPCRHFGPQKRHGDIRHLQLSSTTTTSTITMTMMRFWWYYFFILAIQKKKEEDEEAWENRHYKRRHSRYQKRFHRELGSAEKQIRQRRIPRESLHSVHRSAWRALFFSNNNQALITATGLDHGTFDYLLQKFEPIFNTYTPFGNTITKTSNRGRKRRITAVDCLGLVLVWTRTRGSTMSLQMHFGMSMTNLTMYLRFGRRIVTEVLSNDEYAKIAIPSNETIKQYKQLIKAKYPALKHVWAAMDGLKTPIQQSGSTHTQKYFYNGWKHNHFVTSVFCFCPDGSIPIAHMNLPGATHDSTIADWGNIYIKLEEVYNQTGGICAVDSAFRMRNAPYIIKSSQNNVVGEGPTRAAQRRDIVKKQQATSMRQCSEWGMRALQSSFPHLNDKLSTSNKWSCSCSLQFFPRIFPEAAGFVLAALDFTAFAMMRG